MKVLILTCVILSSGHIWSSFGLEVSEETSKQLPNPSTTSVIENSETAAINPSEKIPKAEEKTIPAKRGPQQPGWGGLISGLLGSITKTADVSECPGKCLHALASLLCEEVREDIQCPAQSMRCCVDRGNKAKPPPPNDLETSESRPETSTKRVRPSPPRKTTAATTTTTKAPTTTKKAVATDKQDKFGDYEYVDSSDSDGTSDSAKKCPGVCVAERLSGFCEAILEIPGICSSTMKCCVSKQIFEGGKVPEGVVIPSRKKEEKKTTQKPKVTTSSSPRSPAQKSTPKPKQSSSTGAACEGGTCVSGFLALLCDEIDRNAECPGNGRCCKTKKVKESKPKPKEKVKCPGFCLPQSMSSLCNSPSNILHNTNSCNKGTVCCESKSAKPKTTKPPRTTTKRPAPAPRPRPQQSGGPDFTSLLLSAAPTILSAATGSQDAGTTAAALLPVLGTLLNSGGGGGGNWSDESMAAGQGEDWGTAPGQGDGSWDAPTGGDDWSAPAAGQAQTGESW